MKPTNYRNRCILVIFRSRLSPPPHLGVMIAGGGNDQGELNVLKSLGDYVDMWYFTNFLKMFNISSKFNVTAQSSSRGVYQSFVLHRAAVEVYIGRLSCTEQQ